jgi:hypothetical protein
MLETMMLLQLPNSVVGTTHVAAAISSALQLTVTVAAEAAPVMLKASTIVLPAVAKIRFTFIFFSLLKLLVNTLYS